MKKFLLVINIAVGLLAFFNEAVRAGIVKPLPFNPINLFGDMGNDNPDEEDEDC